MVATQLDLYRPVRDGAPASISSLTVFADFRTARLTSEDASFAENKEEAQPVNTRKGYYPDDIAGSFGVPVEQHRQESEVRQMDGYVSVGMLTGLPGQQQNTSKSRFCTKGVVYPFLERRSINV